MSIFLKIKNFLKRIAKYLHLYVFFVQIYQQLQGKFAIIEQIECEKIWLGDHDKVNYGGFYICPAPLNSRSIIYSAGIGLDISFDEDVIEKFGCTVYGFDPTPRAIDFVKNHPINNFVFAPYGLNNKDGLVGFHLPKDPQEFVSGSIRQLDHLEEATLMVPMKKISTIMRELKHTQIDVLKMDIEGAEYEVIEDVVKRGIKIDQITLEFHHWLMPNGKEITRKCIKKLNKAGYYIFGISPSGLEVSFIKCIKKIPFLYPTPFYVNEKTQA